MTEQGKANQLTVDIQQEQTTYTRSGVGAKYSCHDNFIYSQPFFKAFNSMLGIVEVIRIWGITSFSRKKFVKRIYTGKFSKTCTI